MKLPNRSGAFDYQSPPAFTMADIDPLNDLTGIPRHVPKRPTLTLR